MSDKMRSEDMGDVLDGADALARQILQAVMMVQDGAPALPVGMVGSAVVVVLNPALAATTFAAVLPEEIVRQLPDEIMSALPPEIAAAMRAPRTEYVPQGMYL